MKLHDWWALFVLGVSFIPGKVWKMFSPNIWVVSEYEKLARDNGYWFYHCMKTKHPEIKSYYPISKESMDYPKINALGNDVKYGGFKHYMLFWAANVWCSSSSIQGFPYPRICDDLVIMNFHRFKYVFLNHGITRGKSYIVNGETTNYSLLITCSELDRKIILEENNQKESVVINTGFARHDTLDDSLLDKKMILVMPTWRENLSYRNENNKSGREKYTKLFLQSAYYNTYNKLINDENLIQFIEDKDLKLIFFFIRMHRRISVISRLNQAGS